MLRALRDREAWEDLRYRSTKRFKSATEDARQPVSARTVRSCCSAFLMPHVARRQIRCGALSRDLVHRYVHRLYASVATPDKSRPSADGTSTARIRYGALQTKLAASFVLP